MDLEHPTPTSTCLRGAYSDMTASERHVDEVWVPEHGTEVEIADYISRYKASIVIRAMLHHRGRTSAGQLIRTSLLRSALHSMSGFVRQKPVTDSELRDLTMAEMARLRSTAVPHSEIAQMRKERRFLGGAFRLFYHDYRALDGVIMLGCLTKTNRDGVRRILSLHGENSGDHCYDAADPVNQQRTVAWRSVLRERILRQTVDE
jgi:crotonobetainyl-CoA:carnitine CoA-transferase CaiB-like acyl-CoA transferase